MKQLTILIIFCFSATVLLSACTKQQSGSVINYQRKIETIEQKNNAQQSYNVIDLSDGKKVNYDAHFGPSFDIE